MRLLGFVLIVLGLLWSVMSFLGTMMMSRSVNTSGRPPRMASILAGKLDCACV